MGFRSDEEYMFFELADPSVDFSVARMRGHEGISELYEFQVELLSEDDDIAFEDVVGQGCVLTILNHQHAESDTVFTEEDTQERFLHGVVSHFEIAEEGARYTTYHAVIVPKIWVMQHRTNCRIFQEKNVKDIVEQLLDELGLEGDEYRWDCQGSYPAYNYCVQYRESEFNFISRLLEHEGIFYYFEHEEDKHVLVFHDDSTTLPSIENDDVPVITTQGGMVSNHYIYAFRMAHSLTPGKVTLRDYNFTKPTMKLESEQKGEFYKEREVYEYPGWFADKARGDKLAKIRLQSAEAYQTAAKGKSNVSRMTPGYSFYLNDERRDTFNDDYLITRVEHVAVQAQVYQEDSSQEGSRYNNRFVCIPLTVAYRPTRESRIPVVEGTQTAIVTGPSGEELYTDEHGRVKVQFHWDREGKSDQDSSCWIRVSQMWAGGGYGGFSLPRIGQEVIVDFIEGNPDNPIVIGRVHHGDNRTPYKLPDKKTVSTLKTNSSKGGGGFNELRFEDKKGEEQIFIHAQMNKDERVRNSSFEWVGNQRHQIVKKEKFTQVEKDEHHIVKGNQFHQVDGDISRTFDANIMQETSGDESYKISGDRKSETGGSEHLKAGKDINLKAGMNFGLNSGTKVDVKSTNINLQAGAAINIKAGGSFISINAGGVFISGPIVMINSGGAAGPAMPSPPAPPVKPEKVEEPIVADNAKAGKVEKVTDKSTPIRPSTYGPQAKAMKQAAESGTPFCEQCEAAKKEQEKKAKENKAGAK
ncbi:type VI secretion system Vgr family protein [Aestuariibacter salexigens]|uniref:type VI secretion system Vgr family protein n=1 Tax=Aestuariibacter salexigens TaxID=226010 RepID=UPI00041184CA|nr:type VI secretion system tip protein VgrG [Aestuariibacter salexigens]